MTALAQQNSDFEYTGLYNQPEFINGIINTMNEFRSVKNLQWDQDIADCAFVTACLRHKLNLTGAYAHGHAMGMRPCNSYTCGGVTCKKTSHSEGAFQFDIREEDGYQIPIRSIVANPDGGHEKPILSSNTTRVGCATHIARANNAYLYCDYSKRPDCRDENCCDQSYKSQLKECKAKVAQGETYYFRSWDLCESYPNADDSIIQNNQTQTTSSPEIASTTQFPGNTSETTTPTAVVPKKCLRRGKKG
jgi:hypothetical protein